MFSKINLLDIVRDHFATLRDDSTGRQMKSDVFLFFILPLIFALILRFAVQISLDTAAINVLVTSLSVFAALLFNLLLLIYDIVRKSAEVITDIKRRFLKEIYANISFSILVSVASVVILLVAHFGDSHPVIECCTDLIAYYLVTLFLLTLFLILKRVHVLLSKEFEDTA